MFKLFVYLILLGSIVALQRSRRLNENVKRQLETTTIDTSAPWEPLRIKFEFITQVDSETQTFLEEVFSISGTFLSRYLLIRRTLQKVQVGSGASSFNEFFLMSDEISNFEYEADLVFFVIVEDSLSKTYLAYCTPVLVDSKTKRPVFGVIGWNMAYTDLTKMTNTAFEAQLATAIHEIIHGLGFIPDFIPEFYDFHTGEKYSDSGSFTTEEGILMITTPRVVAQAQKHFGCDSISGVPMEQEGGDGTSQSHWERSIFYNEMMTGSDMTENFAMSDFTFQFLQDTGFYRLSDYIPDILTWGTNQGCDFFNNQCNGGTFKEFCQDIGYKGCSVGYNGIGSCAVDSLSESCPYIAIEKDFDCRNVNSLGYQDNGASFQEFGYHSMCVVGGFAAQGAIVPEFSCYKYSCDGKFTIRVNNQQIDCSQGGNKTIDGYSGSITCPDDIQQFCQNQDDCLNQCSKRGFCMKGLCVCHGSYYGLDCSYENCNKIKSGTECVDSCASGYFHNSDINYCIGCPGNCQTCTNYNLCTECKEGYELRGGFCDYFGSASNSYFYRQIILGFILFVFWI